MPLYKIKADKLKTSGNGMFKSHLFFHIKKEQTGGGGGFFFFPIKQKRKGRGRGKKGQKTPRHWGGEAGEVGHLRVIWCRVKGHRWSGSCGCVG